MNLIFRRGGGATKDLFATSTIHTEKEAPKILLHYPYTSCWTDKLIKDIQFSGNFSIRFWRQYMSLFASIAAIVVPIVDLRR